MNNLWSQLSSEEASFFEALWKERKREKERVREIKSERKREREKEREKERNSAPVPLLSVGRWE